MKILILLFVLLILPSLGHAERFLCERLEIVGFSYDRLSKKWGKARFNQEQKYVIAPPEDEKIKSEYAYTVTLVEDGGGVIYLAGCKDDFKSGSLICEGDNMEIKFNKNTGRYIIVNSFGYWGLYPHEDEKFDYFRPFMEIGICSAF